MKKTSPERKRIKKELKDAGIKITSTVRKIIDGDQEIGLRSDFNTHKALAIKVPKDLQEVEERGKEMLSIFFRFFG